jgi:hypothetical protein
MTEGDYLGLPDDLARLALQRLMTCDVRWRAYERSARTWQSMATTLGVLVSVSASLAAVSFVKNVDWLAIGLVVAVAIVVPLHNVMAASGRAATNRDAAAKFEMLANDYERYIQLDLGPPMWRREFKNLNQQRATIDVLDGRLSAISSSAPRISFKGSELAATETRAEHLVTYLEMKNVVVPDRAVWAH